MDKDLKVVVIGLISSLMAVIIIVIASVAIVIGSIEYANRYMNVDSGVDELSVSTTTYTSDLKQVGVTVNIHTLEPIDATQLDDITLFTKEATNNWFEALNSSEVSPFNDTAKLDNLSENILKPIIKDLYGVEIIYITYTIRY
jgi:membrane protein insertase Oxa1/YidC/SpoIIIJ